MRNRIGLGFSVLILSPAFAIAQQSCLKGFQLDGTITDPTGSVIAKAQVTLAEGQTAITDTMGHFTLACVLEPPTTITATAEGFASSTAEVVRPFSGAGHINLKLSLASVDATVQCQSTSCS